jgi:hypothetical protein
MLYQPKPEKKSPSPLRRSFAAIAGFLASLTRAHNNAQFDGLSARHLGELGLRRTDDGGYRFFD